MRLMTLRLLVIVLVSPPFTISARTWYVPGDAPSIQAGVDSAIAGDTVLVAPGTYHDCTHTVEGSEVLHCVIMKAGVTLISETGPDSTIIDAQQVGRVMFADSLDSDTRIEGFTITGGHTSNPQYGAGIRARYSFALFAGNTITGNSTTGNGGGISLHYGANVFSQNVISDNHADYYYGGGLYCISSETIFVENRFIDNTAKTGGGIVCDFSLGHPTFSHNLIAGNTALFNGGGIWCNNYTMPLFEGNTIVGNRTHIGDGAAFWSGSTPHATFYGCIFAFNDGNTTFTCTDSSAFECCNVFGNTGGDEICGTDGGGNFVLDPLFCDTLSGDFTLLGDSPCLPGNHPSGWDCGLIGACPVGCPASAVEDHWYSPGALDLAPIAPNPFSPSTRIAYVIPNGAGICPVLLSIYDPVGRLIRTLVNGQQPTGTYSVTWDGTNQAGAVVAAGVYFCRLRIGGEQQTRRMLLVR